MFISNTLGQHSEQVFFILAEIEIPRIVEKTRALLALRGFSTYELLEYEDRFVMHPREAAMSWKETGSDRRCV